MSIIALFIFLLMTLIFVSADNSEKEMISDSNVSYNTDLIKAFEDRNYAQDLISQDNFIGLQIRDNKTFARIRVVLKDNSRIVIEGSKEQIRDLTNQRLKWFEPITEELIKNLPESEFLEIRLLSEGFSALVSKEGFELLLKNEYIKEIIWSQYKPESINSENAENPLLLTLIITFIFLGVFLIYFLSKRRNKK